MDVVVNLEMEENGRLHEPRPPKLNHIPLKAKCNFRVNQVHPSKSLRSRVAVESIITRMIANVIFPVRETNSRHPLPRNPRLLLTLEGKDFRDSEDLLLLGNCLLHSTVTIAHVFRGLCSPVHPGAHSESVERAWIHAEECSFFER